MENKKLIKIDEKKVRSYLEACLGELKNVTHSFMQEQTSDGRISAAGFGNSRQTVNVKLYESILGVTEESLITESQAKVLNSLRDSLAIATEVGNNYKAYSGYNDLKSNKNDQRLADAEINKLSEMEQAHSAICVHVFCSSVLNDLSTSDPKVNVVPNSVEIDYRDSFKMLSSLFYGLNNNILEYANNDDSLVSTVVAVLESVLDSNIIFSRNLNYIDSFEYCTFMYEPTSLEINGFTKSVCVKKSNLPMKRVEPKDVVGNAIAKYQVVKLAKMMMCYDMKAKKNPFAELGGFTFTIMGDGNPGTGKTTLIQMFCTILKDYCDHAGYNFYYENFSTDQISEYQGKSAQNAKSFINNILDPDSICFGTIDDIDQIAGKRGDKSSSSGQQEITAVLMEAFAGANTVIRGNAAFGMFSNYPEMIDDALRQRSEARWLIDGPQSMEDFGDLATILLSGISSIEQGDRIPFETQEIRKAVSASYDAHNQPKEEALLAVYHKTLRECGGSIKTIQDFEKYFYNIKVADPRFTGRAIQNITKSAKRRAMDIDLPDEWFTGDLDLFINKSYDDKLSMIKELIGEVTPEMLIQETNIYADSEFRYSGKSDQLAIDSMVRELTLSEKARFIYNQSKAK